MRVIAGRLRSRRLMMVDDQTTRETKDRVKESIFNMIGPYHILDDVLDLFAGSGSLGIEAHSRGAKNVVFVDQAFNAIKVINQNIEELKIKPSSTVFHMDAFLYMNQANISFDLIFLDPPYHQISIEECLMKIDTKKLLKDDGLIVVLSDRDTTIHETNNFMVVKEKRITRTNVVFLKWRK